MLKIVAAGLTALLVTASSHALAQAPAGGIRERLSAADMNALVDARIVIIKSTLQLTPEQEKYWPAIEAAIRERAKDRQTRLEGVQSTVGEARANPVEALRDRNPIEFMQRRSQAIIQRGTDLKKLTDAWQPLYQTLTTEQKRRMGYLAMYVVREMRTNAEDRRTQSDQDQND